MADEGIFAGRHIKFWAQFTEKELLGNWGISEKQIPALNKLLADNGLKLRDKTKLEEQAERDAASEVSEASPAKKTKK